LEKGYRNIIAGKIPTEKWMETPPLGKLVKGGPMLMVKNLVWEMPPKIWRLKNPEITGIWLKVKAQVFQKIYHHNQEGIPRLLKNKPTG